MILPLDKEITTINLKETVTGSFQEFSYFKTDKFYHLRIRKLGLVVEEVGALNLIHRNYLD